MGGVHDLLPNVCHLWTIQGMPHRQVHRLTCKELLLGKCHLLGELLPGMRAYEIAERAGHVLEDGPTGPTGQDVDKGITCGKVLAFLVSGHDAGDVPHGLLSSAHTAAYCGTRSYLPDGGEVIHRLDQLDGVTGDITCLGGCSSGPAEPVAGVDDLRLTGYRHDRSQQADGIEEGADYLACPERHPHTMLFHAPVNHLPMLLLGIVLGHGNLDDTLFLTFTEVQAFTEIVAVLVLLDGESLAAHTGSGRTIHVTNYSGSRAFQKGIGGDGLEILSPRGD